MSNRISDADIDAILREFSEQLEQEAKAAASPSPQRKAENAPAAPESSPRRDVRHEPRPEQTRERPSLPEKPREREAARKTPPVSRTSSQPVREAAPVRSARPAFSFGCLILILISLFALTWALVNIHPGTGTATASRSSP